MAQRTPILLNSCARATTAAESSYRIQSGPDTPRASRIIALDAGATRVLETLAADRWAGGHFLELDEVSHREDGSHEVSLHPVLGRPTTLDAELGGADVVVMIATADVDAHAAGAIGDACADRSIMSAALVVSDLRSAATDAVVAALRPNAMVMLRLGDAGDVADVLSALRA